MRLSIKRTITGLLIVGALALLRLALMRAAVVEAVVAAPVLKAAAAASVAAASTAAASAAAASAAAASAAAARRRAAFRGGGFGPIRPLGSRPRLPRPPFSQPRVWGLRLRLRRLCYPYYPVYTGYVALASAEPLISLPGPLG